MNSVTNEVAATIEQNPHIAIKAVELLHPEQWQSSCHAKIVNEYDQEIPQSQTADKPMTARG